MRHPLLRSKVAWGVSIATCVLLGGTWVAYRVQHNASQRRVVERIWRMGGGVFFEGEPVMVRPLSKRDWQEETQKTWVHDAVANRIPTQIMFARAVNHSTDVADDDVDELVAAIRQLPSVAYVRLDATDISPEGVKQLQAELPGIHIEKPGVN